MAAPPPSDEPSVRLFSYGTLRLPAVQQGTFGRLLDGAPDVLVGYRLEPLEIGDPAVVALSGAAVHHIARRTGNSQDRIEGVVFALTQAELEAGDRYEVDVYGRIEAALESGTSAFIYVGPDSDGAAGANSQERG